MTTQLRALEADGLVHREVHAEVPPRVVYSATPLAVGLTQLFRAMHAWATTNQLMPTNTSEPTAADQA